MSRRTRDSILSKRITSGPPSTSSGGGGGGGGGGSVGSVGAGDDKELPQLYLRVDGGKGFPANVGGFLYCTVKLESVAEQSNYVLASPEPRWGDEFVFHVKQKMSCVELIFYLVDEEGAETTYLGECNIPIHTLASHKLLAETFVLELQNNNNINNNNREVPDQVPAEVNIVLFNSLQKSAMDALRELEDVYAGFLTLCSENMGLLSLLFDCIDSSEADRVGTSVVSMFNFLRKEVELFQWVIRGEVEATSSMSVLFRSNSMAIRLVSLFAKLTASQYIKVLLLPLIQETLAQDCTKFEVDPARLDVAGAANLKKNQKNLQDLVSKFLDAILASVDRVPRVLRRVCGLFVDLVEGKFPGGSSRAVGGFYFLRYVCPAIVAPATFGLVQQHPTGAHHRALLLVAKVLQNISNLTHFKEPEMECFNAYLLAKQPDVMAFLGQVAVVNPANEGEPVVSIRPAAVAEGCVLIAKLMRQNATRMREKVEDDEHAQVALVAPAVFGELDKILRLLADSEQVHEKPYNASRVEVALRKDGVVKIQARSHLEEEAEEDEEDADILNTSRVWHRPTRPGAAKDLVTGALEIYLSECQKAGKAKAVDWVAVCGPKGPRYSEVKHLESAVCELQKTDFQQMLSLPQKVAFWLNVYHTLMFHVLFTVGFPKTAHAEKLFYSHFRYRLGPFTLSLRDIEGGVLRGNLPDKNGLRQWREADKRRVLCLPKEPRVLLALANLTIHTPVVVPYGMQVEKQLTAVLTHFLNAAVQVDAPRKEVLLPRQFNRFTSEYPSVMAKNQDPDKATIAWIYNYLIARKKLDLLYLQGKPCGVVVSKKTSKMMMPSKVVEYYAEFEKRGEVNMEELPEMFNMGGRVPQLAAKEAAPASPVLGGVTEVIKGRSMTSPVAMSPGAFSGPSSPPPEPAGEPGLSRGSNRTTPPPRSSVTTSESDQPQRSSQTPAAAAAAAAATTTTPPIATVPVDAGAGNNAAARTRMHRQASVLDENVMRDSIATMVKKVTSDLYDGQGVAEAIYADVCRTISVTTAFNTGKIIREVKVSLLDLPGIVWTPESLEKFKQNCPLETPELTRLQKVTMPENKQTQLLKLLNAIQTAVVDIRFLMENVISVLNKSPSQCLPLIRVVPEIKQRLQFVLERIQEKNAENAPMEELITLEAAIAPEIDSLVALLGLLRDQLRGIDLGNDSGRMSLLAFAAILAWVKQQLELPKAGPPFKPQVYDRKQVEELSEQKLQEITQVLKSLIESVTRRLKTIKSKLLVDATREKLLEAAAIIRNCRAALLSQ